MVVVFLSLASVVSWFLSTLTGGGSPMMLLPVSDWLLGAAAVPPVLTVGMLGGNAQRLVLYGRHIHWPLTLWYLPGALVGAITGAWALTRIHFTWLPLLLGLFLILSALSCAFENRLPCWEVRSWWFLPAGFIYGTLSGLVGSAGPLLNPLYLHYGLDKEAMIATKAAHLVAIHITKLVSYTCLGVLTLGSFKYGLIIALAALPGNWLGKRWLQAISEAQFRRYVVGFVMLSGLLLIWEHTDRLAFW